MSVCVYDLLVCACACAPYACEISHVIATFLSRFQFRTLSKICFHCRLGLLDAGLSRPLFPHLLEAGIVFLFRWALDDSNPAVAAAAIQGFHAILGWLKGWVGSTPSPPKPSNDSTPF